MSLGDYFWAVWRNKHHESGGQLYHLPGAVDNEESSAQSRQGIYVFQFASPHLRLSSITRPQQTSVLPKWGQETITLVAMRDKVSFRFFDRKETEGFAFRHGWSCVTCLQFSTLREAGLTSFSVSRPYLC